MSPHDEPTPQFRKYKSTDLNRSFSEEEMARDWTLDPSDLLMIHRFRKNARLYIGIQLCSIRLYGRFLIRIQDIALSIIHYLNKQLGLPVQLTPDISNRKATQANYHNAILSHLGFKRFSGEVETEYISWLRNKLTQGELPDILFEKSQQYLLDHKVLLPGASTLGRLLAQTSNEIHLDVFQNLYNELPPSILSSIEQVLQLPEGAQRSFFFELKEYPPSASITTIKKYLLKYDKVMQLGIDELKNQFIDPAFQEYLYQMTQKYSAKDLKRFDDPKRYAMMICFLIESRKKLLDYLVALHDQYILDMTREAKNTYNKHFLKSRKKNKKSMTQLLSSVWSILDWLDDTTASKATLFEQLDTQQLRDDYDHLSTFNQFVNKGHGHYILLRYPSLRKYFAEFIKLPFAAAKGSESLLIAVELVRNLDSGVITKLPQSTPTHFVPNELRHLLYNESNQINRNAWECSLAIAIKNALRAGDLYLAQSKEHVSFWDLILSQSNWDTVHQQAYSDLQQPASEQAITQIREEFHAQVTIANEQLDTEYASIVDGMLKLKRYDKLAEDPKVKPLQKVIDNNMPYVRIEELLIEVDKKIHFTEHFKPISGHASKPKNFYKTLIAAIISQATNLGVVGMSASMKDTSVDKLRHVLHHFIREDTIKAANARIVDKHHHLPLAKVYGQGNISSSDAQRFGIRASSMLASYYPRYYGYYQKAIGIYTHVSDQYAVFNTKAISCGPREALYVLDGLLENNTVLNIKAHTTDTHGFTEIIFALCHLLGYYFMPRIRDIKDQQLYRIDKHQSHGAFDPIITKTVDKSIVKEQWDMMVRVAYSLRQRTAPAHVIVERLMNSVPNDRLTTAFINLGRIIKTKYILRYITDAELRRTVQRQLNKGEYRHKLPRRIFFNDQGEFNTGNYDEIMNKASCLSLVSNAVLYWNTTHINNIITDLRANGEQISDETLSHISLLPFKHVIANGSYFIDDYLKR